MHDTINGAMFKEMLLFGTVSIAQAQQAINDLNVFPVPDGDTGTNMSLTIQTAAQELKKIEPATVDQAASVTASALLRGARGNSGVILSLLFRGISKELKGCIKDFPYHIEFCLFNILEILLFYKIGIRIFRKQDLK